MDDLGIRKQMVDSIDKMVRYSRRNEKQKETNQL
jgi:hypothetical protein